MIDINKNSYIYFNPPLSKNINEILENKEKLKEIYEFSTFKFNSQFK